MPRTILFIEDEFHTIKEFGEILELNGDEIEVAVNAADALARLKHKHVDLVVLDIMMPHGGELPVSMPAMATGLGILKLIRSGESGQSPDLPVVVLTAAADSQLLKEIHRQLEPGVFLHKPVSIETFLSSVDCALLSPVRRPEGSGWSEDVYQKQMVERFSGALVEMKSYPRTAATQAGLRVLANAMDCELAAVVVRGTHGLRASYIYTPELAIMDQWSGAHLHKEGLLAEVQDLGEYRAINDNMEASDSQLARLGVRSVLAVPFEGFHGRPAILLACNRRPFAKHEARFLSYDGELCRLFAEHLLGAQGAAYAKTEEDYQTRLTHAARDIAVRYDSLWRKVKVGG